MIKQLKKFTKRFKNNQGNSFIVVVATTSFLAVLVSALLVAVALIYRLKAFDINARDNFYYLEQAVDEIYAGVGADSMRHLNKAYDKVVEVLVYYDTETKSYKNMDNDNANELMKRYFIENVKNDPNYENANIAGHLKSFLSNPAPMDADGNVILNGDGSVPEGIQLYVTGNVVSTDTDVTVTQVVLKREAKYSTINTRKDAGGKETFIQTITTDLVIAQPEFDVNFNSIGTDLNDLYQFSMIADMGIEIKAPMESVNITGNVYGAADFYNKEYTRTETTTDETTGITTSNTVAAPVTSYTDTQLANCNGVELNSMYSGFYIEGADVTLAANKIIVPGTIAVMNAGKLAVSGLNQTEIATPEIWADNITLSGYSKKDILTNKPIGSSASLRANVYMSDDLELNAAGSDFYLNGQYYGYNYSSASTRVYTEPALLAAKNRTFISKDEVDDGIAALAHYNSSAIVVNGENSNLDLTSVSAMYIAGQSYVELSKNTTTSTIEGDDPDSDEDDITTYTYNYPEYSTEEQTVGSDTVTVEDNYTTNPKYYETDEDGNFVYQTDSAGNPILDENGLPIPKLKQNANPSDKVIQDYRTGEAISIKSNQLAYIPNWAVTDNEDGLFFKVPTALQNLDLFKDAWNDLEDRGFKIPVIKTIISGKTYYFFDFTNADEGMNEFIAAYSALMDETYTDSDGNEVSRGEALGFFNINDYDYFKIQNLSLQEDLTNTEEGTTKYNIYSNSAISVMNGTTVTVKAKSSSIASLTTAADRINEAVTKRHDGNQTEAEADAEWFSASLTDNGGVLATGVTTRLQQQYKEMKYLLSRSNTSAVDVTEARDMAESTMTPINHYFKYEMLGSLEQHFKCESGYEVWLDKDDVVVAGTTENGGNVKGLIICKGDVTFDDSVKSFEGLIVSGSKVIISTASTRTTMDFIANEEIVKTILRECDESERYSGNPLTASRDHSIVCKLFRQYERVYQAPDGSADVPTESMKSISAIQFEDILSFNNWQKNVD